MPVKSATVAAWINNVLGWGPPNEEAPLVPGPYVPKMPDRIVVVTATPGLGYQMDGAMDAPGFQVRVRGLASSDDIESYTDAESLAFTLDRLIYDASFPVVIDGQAIVKVFRQGGQPAPLGPDPDDGDRYQFTTNYIIVVGV
jgi:hypothetical protein